MFRVPDETVRRFDAAMDAARIGMQERGYYQKWLRYYLDFCDKYRLPSVEEGSLTPFLEKLAAKNQSDMQRQQASRAIRLFFGMRRAPQQESTPAGVSRPIAGKYRRTRHLAEGRRQRRLSPKGSQQKA